MMPRDANPLGSIFGGHIVSLIDQAAVQCAVHFAKKTFVTKVIREVEFYEPISIGDVVSLYASIRAVGTTSVTVAVDVDALHLGGPEQTNRVTSAEVVLVAVDRSGKPSAIGK